MGIGDVLIAIDPGFEILERLEALLDCLFCMLFDAVEGLLAELLPGIFDPFGRCAIVLLFLLLG